MSTDEGTLKVGPDQIRVGQSVEPVRRKRAGWDYGVVDSVSLNSPIPSVSVWAVHAGQLTHASGLRPEDIQIVDDYDYSAEIEALRKREEEHHEAPGTPADAEDEAEERTPGGRFRRGALSYRLRFQVLQRCGFRCAYCGAPARTTPLEVDHLVPVSRGGRTEGDNLAAACFKCNRGKGDLLVRRREIR